MIGGIYIMGNLKLTEEQKVAIWKARIERGKNYAKKNFWENAKEDIKFFSGDHFEGLGLSKDTDLLTINYTWSIIKSLIPQTYYEDPYIKLTAQSPNWVESRQLAEDYLNYCWKKMKIKRQLRKIILDWYVTGLGVRKLGYFQETVKNTNLETAKEYSFLVKDEYPYFLRQSPLDVVVDPEAKNLDDIRWLAARYYVPIDDLQSRESLKYKGVENLKGKHMPEDLLGKKFEEIDSDIRRVELWEIEDYVDNKILTLSGESDKFLRDIENPYFQLCDIKSNYGLLYNNEIPDKPYPQSDVFNLKRLNQEYDKTRTQIMQHRKKSQRKIVYEDGVFATDEELAKFLNDEDLVPAKVVREGVGKIAIFSAATPDANLYDYCGAILFDMNNIARSGFNQRAVEAPTEKTATEASIIEKNAQLGNAERLDVMTDFIIDTARELLAILQKFPSEEKKFYVERRREWQTFRREDIAGDYGVNIEVGAVQRKDSLESIQRANDVFSLLINLTDIDESTGQERLLVDRERLARWTVEKYGLREDEVEKLIREKSKIPPKEIATLTKR